MSHGHDHPHGGTAEFDPDDRNHFTQEFWDERYRSADRLWNGQPNPQLVAQIAGLPPAAALDAGSGEGADAIWLASRGWAVTAVDVSAVALDRAAGHAEAEGAHVSWQREALLTWDPLSGRLYLALAQ